MKSNGHRQGFKWTLAYNGVTKEFVVTEYREAGGEFHQLSQTIWSEMKDALGHIEKTNANKERNA